MNRSRRVIGVVGKVLFAVLTFNMASEANHIASSTTTEMRDNSLDQVIATCFRDIDTLDTIFSNSQSSVAIQPRIWVWVPLSRWIHFPLTLRMDA
jgi:hypothetical protein